jgi:hypothetical protein
VLIIRHRRPPEELEAEEPLGSDRTQLAPTVDPLAPGDDVAPTAAPN